MIDLISEYVKSIAIFLVFIAFIGIILPGKKYKNYIDIVLGLILIFVMLQPIIDVFFNQNQSYEEILQQAEDMEETAPIAFEGQEQYAQEIQTQMIDQNYKTLIKKQVDTIAGQLNFKVTSFDIDYEGSTGIITNMYLSVEATAPPEETTKPFIRIEPVEIDIENKEQEQENQEVTETEEIKNLKTAISDFYNLPIDNIHITEQKKS